MGRIEKFSRDRIKRTTLELVSDRGPGAATISEINRLTGAPTGSIYHKFKSRELLLSEIWLSVVESFQSGFLAALEGEDTFEAGMEGALFTTKWVRGHLNEARILLLYRQEDFVSGDWPEEHKNRAIKLKQELVAGLKSYAKRRFGAEYKAMMTRISFAMIHVPLGAVKPFIQMKKTPPGELDELIAATYKAVLPKI